MAEERSTGASQEVASLKMAREELSHQLIKCRCVWGGWVGRRGMGGWVEGVCIGRWVGRRGMGGWVEGVYREVGRRGM